MVETEGGDETAYLAGWLMKWKEVEPLRI